MVFKNRKISTLGHEAYHGFGIYHTHRDDDLLVITQKNKKYVYVPRTTTNIISYSLNRYSSWRWQWNIINPKIKEK